MGYVIIIIKQFTAIVKTLLIKFKVMELMYRNVYAFRKNITHKNDDEEMSRGIVR